MAWVLPALGIASSVAGAFQKTPRPDVWDTYNRWSQVKPEGYLTGLDYAEQARQEANRNAGIGANIGNARAAAITRAARGNYSTSPAAEAAQEKLTQQQGGALERSSGITAGNLYRTGLGREEFARRQAMEGFGADIAGQRMQYNREAAQKGAFWNSVNAYAPYLMDYFGGPGKGSAEGGFYGAGGAYSSSPEGAANTIGTALESV